MAAVAAAASTTGCSYANAGTGTYAQTLCWLDMSGVSAANPNISVNLGGGYVLTGTVTTTGPTVAPSSFPTYGAAFLGNTLNGQSFYTGVSGKPAIYQTASGTSTVTLGNIQLTYNSTAVTGYSLVVADAESTDNGESITWTNSGSASGFRLLPNNPSAVSGTMPGSGVASSSWGPYFGNNCGNGTTNGAGGGFTYSPTTVTSGWSTVKCASTANYNKTGTVMLSANAPSSGGKWSVTQSMVGAGLQAVAFGVLVAKVAANVTLTDRIVNTTASFTSLMSGPSLPTAVTASTGSAGTTATMSPVLVPVGATASTYTAGLSADTTGALNDYTISWNCVNAASSSWSPGAVSPDGLSIPFPVNVGDSITCTVTLTPPYLTLSKTVDNTNAPLGGSTPASWTLSAATTGSPPTTVISQTASQNITPGTVTTGSTTKVAVPVGSYALGESGTPAGYLQDSAGWACTSGGGADASSVTVAKGAAITCTVTNRAQLGQVTWSKVGADGTTLLAGSAWTLTPTNPSGTAITVTDCATGAGGTCPAGGDQDPVAGQFRVTGLKWGTYSLTETQAPPGYALATSPSPVTISGSNLNTASFGAITDTRLTGTVTWSKVGTDGKTLLSGSTWTWTPTSPAGTAVTVTDCATGAGGSCSSGGDQDPVAGQFKLTGLAWGSYTLQEKTAPPGFTVNPTVYKVTFDATNVATTFAVGAVTDNLQTVPQLPLTGGVGADLFLASGGGLLGLCSCLALVTWRRRRSGS